MSESESINARILSHLKSKEYRPTKPRKLANAMRLASEAEYHAFRDALRDLMHEGRVVLGAGGSVVLPAQTLHADLFVGTYRQNKRGFGFIVPTDPANKEDLFIPEGENAGAITGDIVRAKIVNREQRDGKTMYRGRIIEIVQRTQRKFVGSLARQHGQWLVLPDGNTFTEPILTPDAAARHIAPGTKVVVELTTYPSKEQRAQGVITEVLGAAGEKDVDLKSVIVQFNLPAEFPEEAIEQARNAVAKFNSVDLTRDRLDLSNEIICTIDPDDAKDYDDAISLRQLDNGDWELGVHIADVSFFVESESPLDIEAKERGNSCYFPGHVIPMLPEVLSNGVCSLQADVPRLCKSAFITYDEDAQPIATRFANTIIRSAQRLRYKEAQAIIDNVSRDPGAPIPHPHGEKHLADYPPEVIDLLHDMNTLSRRIQKRRLAAGQLVLDLPEVELVLDENGKVVDAVPEDQSFTHTLIEMFMVEANEAVARLLDAAGVPFLRRIHPEPDLQDTTRLRTFVEVSGYRLPKELDRKALQALLASVRGKPEAFAINLAALKSLTRAEYSPQVVGHYALASQHYCHFTSPIRRYADLTIHRLLDIILAATGNNARGGRRAAKVNFDEAPTHGELVELGRHISFTERRADDAERELRQVKLLELMTHHVGEDFAGIITGITNFGIFVQLQHWLIDGLIRYEDLMDDWWDVDVPGGFIRGQRTGKRIGIGDLCTARVIRVDPPRRELDLAIVEHKGRPGKLGGAVVPHREQKPKKRSGALAPAPAPPMAQKKPGKHQPTGGATRRNRTSKRRGR